MNLRVETVNNVTVIYVDGDIFAEDAERLKEAFENLFINNKTKVILCLDKTDIISSVGLGVILSSLIKFRKYRGNIMLCGVKDFVRKILKTTKVDTILECHASLETALEMMK